MYTANQIADWFILKVDKDKGDSMSPLKLQKLVYYAQAWHLTIFGTPLINERVEAWVNGPVFPSLFARFAMITKYAAIDIAPEHLQYPHINEIESGLLNEVWSVYGEYSASYLEDLTHSEKPWIVARGNKLPHERCNEEITHDSMRDFYQQFLKTTNE